MPKKTMLEMVQDILISLEYDEVNHIDDTPEAIQVSNVIKATYFNLLSDRKWEHLKLITKLEQVGDTTQPTKLRCPDNIYKVYKVEYDKKLSTDTDHRYEEILYMTPEEFLTLSNTRRSSDTTTTTCTTETGVILYIRNDVMPTYYTSFDDEAVYFDSFYSTDESTVQASKTVILAIKEPAFTMTDDFIPDMPQQHFTLLLEKSRATSSLRHRQLIDKEAEMQATKQYNILRNDQYRMNGGMKFVNYGRRTRMNRGQQ